MRKMVFAAALAVAWTALGSELLYVQTAKGHQCVGDEFPIDNPMEVLFQSRKCDLPLAHADDMRAYVMRAGGQVLRGCWGKTLDGSYVIVSQSGNVSRSASNAYVTAKTISDSTAVVTASPNQGTPWAQAMGMCP